MARKPRVEFDGALYHVIVRGNHRRDIFSRRKRPRHLPRTRRALSRAVSLHSVRLRADVESRSFTDRNGRGGAFKDHARDPVQLYATLRSPLPRDGPFISRALQVDFMRLRCVSLELIRYIHLNPARMKHPQNPWTYRWSSHRAYIGEHVPVPIQTNALPFGRSDPGAPGPTPLS